MPYKIYSANSPIIQRLNPKPFRLNLPRYCQQDITGFYTIEGLPGLDEINYCEHTREICVTEITGIDKTNIAIPTFLPTDSALWLDADDSSTFTLVGGAVSEWRDKSGNNRHATQATAGNRPLLVANKISFSTTSTLNLLCPQTINSTVFFVVSTVSMSDFKVFLNRTTNLAPYPPAIYLNTNNNVLGLYWGTNVVNSSFPASNTLDIFSVTFTATNVTFRNSNTESVISHSQTVLSDWVAIHNASVQNTTFDLYSLIIFPRILTQAEREEMEGYLAWSTGLQGNLPVGHPYKNSYTGVTVTEQTVCTDFYFIDTYPDTDISVAVSPSSVLENSGTPLVFTFTLAQAIAHNTTVNYTVSGTASLGDDFPIPNGTATIIAGQTSVDVSITPTGDTNVESDETIIITIKNAMANSQFIAFGSQISATGTITNDDSEVLVNAVVNVSVSPSSVNENAGIPLVFTFTVNNPPAPINSDCTINFTIGGTATAGVDYPSGQPTSIVIPTGQSSATLSITPIGDSLVESNETISVSMQSASATGYSFFFGNSSSTGTITNDD